MFKKLNKAFLLVVFALPLIKAQDVSIAVGDTAFAGYTDDIVVPITVSNPNGNVGGVQFDVCLLYTSPSPRDKRQSRMPSSA